MPKISRFQLDKNMQTAILRQLASAFKEIRRDEEMRMFMDNLFTRTERLMLAKRLAIAILLESGWDYSRIIEALKVSPSTISFVRNSKLNMSAPYQKLIERLIKYIT